MSICLLPNCPCVDFVLPPPDEPDPAPEPEQKRDLEDGEIRREARDPGELDPETSPQTTATAAASAASLRRFRSRTRTPPPRKASSQQDLPRYDVRYLINQKRRERGADRRSYRSR